MPRRSCFVIGEGAIALECLEILATAQVIHGIYSPDQSLLVWAEAREIPHPASRAEFEALLLSSQYDHLFSINNGWILPEAVLKQARRGTINYHNSPLPKYAGVHATTWAIIQGETEHAVTWHEVVGAIDAGRILKQVKFPILADDRALSLNTRCAETAIAAFAELVEELAQNRVKPMQQDLRQRSYFGLNDRPVALLDWEQPTATLCNLIRALDFAPLANPIALPKLWLPGGVVAVTQSRSMQADHPLPPGQVLALDATGLQVATADGSLELGGITTLAGLPLRAADLSELGVRVGSILPLLTAAQREAICSQTAAICRHERTWVKQLAQLAPFVHPLQTSPLAGVSKAEQSGRISIMLPADVSAGVSAGVSAETLLAGFAAYCGRLTNAPEFDLAWQLLGFDARLFAQSVPVRIVRRDETFAQFRDRFTQTLARTKQLGSYALDVVARYPQLSSLRQITLPVALRLADSPQALEPSEAALTCVAYRDGSPPELIYSSAIEPLNAAAIVEQLQVLLIACCEQPQQSVQTLPLLPKAQMQQMLVNWNDTAAAYPSQCIHQLIADQAARCPDAIAVWAETSLSYRELDRRSNQLARWLVQLGVQPDTLVAVCLPRSVELLIGLLAVLKAGGAYVPIDPTYPRDRIAYLLADSRPLAIVTTAALRDRLFLTVETAAICLDEQAALLDSLEAEPLPTAVTATNLAYVIYTSGSTGQPKGVEIEHRSLVNHSWAMADIYNLTASDRMLQSASISFDIAGEQIYPTLLRGGTVVIRPDNLLESFDRFTRFIEAQQITTMVLPTAFWHEWVAELVATQRSVANSLRLLAVGTEKVLAHRLEQWQHLTSGRIAFFQGYGPTEATITCTLYCHNHHAPLRTPIPIGRPLPNTQAYILDSQLQPVPIGVVGELYIGGAGLARGYRRQRELSERQFIAHPFQPDAYLYRTGDFARFEPNGDIVFCDRRDHQIKLNGFRIELGEIEAVLNDEPTVKQAIVHPHRLQDKHILVAYVVTLEPDSMSQLQRHLAQKLPHYMLPAAILPLAKLPQLPNGKIDRAALPLPQQMTHPATAARNETERQLVAIWQEILELATVGIYDNFFALGGNSLAAVRLADRIQAAFRRDLPLATVFQLPSIAQLAAVLDQLNHSSAPILALTAAPSIVALQPKGDRRPLFLFQGIELYRSLAMQLDPDQPVYGLAHEITQQTFDSIPQLATHYFQEMRTVQPQGPYLLGGASLGGMIALEVAQQLQAAGETVALLALFDTAAPGAFWPKTRPQQLWGHLHNLSQFGWRYARKIGWRYARKRIVEKLERALHQVIDRLQRPRHHAAAYRSVQATYAQLAASYQPQPYRGRVTLFLATDRSALKDTVCDPALVEIDPLFGWGKLALEGVELHEISGDHLGILSTPQVERLAAQLQRSMEQATASAPLVNPLNACSAKAASVAVGVASSPRQSFVDQDNDSKA